MHSLVDCISGFCLRKGIVTDNQLPWFKYGLEKRISSILVSIPFFFLAVILSDIFVASAFFTCFYVLRSRTNGFHAKTFWGCFFLSIVYVILFIGVLYHILDTAAIGLVAIIGASCIWMLAPFNSSEMHLSNAEEKACRTSSRISSISILLGGFVFQGFGLATITKGLFLGIAMAAYLLCLAYILNGGFYHGKRKRSNQEPYD